MTVAPGGRLVYATCSTEPEENEEVVADFVSRVRGFTRVPAERIHRRLDPLLFDEEGSFRTEPDRHALEGFFGAVLERASTL
jgi:16S rRNA (cytosine967-C5)-methyltransferase